MTRKPLIAALTVTFWAAFIILAGLQWRNIRHAREMQDVMCTVRREIPDLFQDLPVDRGVNAIDGDHGGTALHAAATAGRPDLVQLLLARGADPAMRDQCGYTPLHILCSDGRIEMARALIASGADVNAADNCGSTPLHAAVIWNDVELAELLIANGADVTATNRYGDNPYERREFEALLHDRGSVAVL